MALLWQIGLQALALPVCTRLEWRLLETAAEGPMVQASQLPPFKERLIKVFGCAEVTA